LQQIARIYDLQNRNIVLYQFSRPLYIEKGRKISGAYKETGFQRHIPACPVKTHPAQTYFPSRHDRSGIKADARTHLILAKFG
jgi:hypothetical protein